jgi:hypothetical protein
MPKLRCPISKLSNGFTRLINGTTFSSNIGDGVKNPSPLEKEIILQYRKMLEQISTEPIDERSYSMQYIELAGKLIPHYVLATFDYDFYSRKNFSCWNLF